MLTIEDIYHFIEDECGIKSKKLLPDSDLNGNFGIEGDDFDELMLAYSNKFKVNIDSYLWYFHCNEEGVSLLAFIFPPPNFPLYIWRYYVHKLSSFTRPSSIMKS